jgi:hypothetical protein
MGLPTLCYYEQGRPVRRGFRPIGTTNADTT